MNGNFREPDLIRMHLKGDKKCTQSKDVHLEGHKKGTKSKDVHLRKRNKKRQDSGHLHHDNDVAYDREQEYQPVSIHKLNMIIINRTAPKTGCTTMVQKIRWIVDQYNNKQLENYKYKEHEAQTPQVNSKDQKYFMGDEFEVMVFVQVIPKTVSFLRGYGVKEQSQIVHGIVFHYRVDEIFAVTSGAGWNVVEKVSDFEFSGQLAARILSVQGSLESTKKGLVGNDTVSRKTHKRAEAESPFALLEFCMNYKAELRETACVFKLSCFQKTSSNDDDDEESNNEETEDQAPVASTYPNANSEMRPVCGIKVTVNLRSVRILRRFKPSDILGILSFFSQISKGLPTTDIYGMEEKNSSAHINYLSPVSKETSDNLDRTLVRMIHDALWDRVRLDALDNFDFIHKLCDRFFDGEMFTLNFGRSKVRVWENRPPTCREVATALVDSDLTKDKVLTEEEFYNRFQKVRVSYKVRTEPSPLKPDKLLNFFDGILPFNGEVFWHVQGKWCRLRETYLLTVHREILAILENNLISNERHEPSQFPFKLEANWPSPTTIAEFIRELDSTHGRVKNITIPVNIFIDQNRSRPDIFVPNESFELFDMIRVRNGSNLTMESIGDLILYYIVPSLSYQIVNKGTQISSSLMSLRKAVNTDRNLAGSEHTIESLKSIHCELKGTVKPQFRRLFDFDMFLKKLADAEICLVIGKGSEEDVRRPISLEEESNRPTTITENHLEDVLKKEWATNKEAISNISKSFVCGVVMDMENFEPLSKKIVEELKKSKLLEGSGEITGKFVCASKSNFELVSAKQLQLSLSEKHFIYEKLVNPFQPINSNILAKLEIIRLDRTLRECGYRSFKILDVTCDWK
jgi:hypothetical protein